MFTKPSALSLISACAAMFVLAGCGSETPAPPPGAVRPPDPHPPLSTKKNWTLQDKIDAVTNSGMSPDQKKKTIDDLKAGGH